MNSDFNSRAKGVVEPRSRAKESSQRGQANGVRPSIFEKLGQAKRSSRNRLTFSPIAAPVLNLLTCHSPSLFHETFHNEAVSLIIYHYFRIDAGG